jgi:3-hydroxyisobutyrate dehydrogenase
MLLYSATGMLGPAFVEGLLSRGGTTVTVWNRTRARAEPLAALGARIADTPADAVKDADRVHLVLLDDEVVNAAIIALKAGSQARCGHHRPHDHAAELATASRAAALDRTVGRITSTRPS